MSLLAKEWETFLRIQGYLTAEQDRQMIADYKRMEARLDALLADAREEPGSRMKATEWAIIRKAYEWGQSNYVNPPFGAITHDGKRKGGKR
jgi:hypothetical protein